MLHLQPSERTGRGKVCMEANQLPTKPGPYYWRESDGGEWEIAQINRCMDVYFVGCDMHYGLKKTGGQWIPIPPAEELLELRAKAKAYDEGRDVWSVVTTDGISVGIGVQRQCIKLATEYNESPVFQNGYTCRKVRVCKEVVE